MESLSDAAERVRRWATEVMDPRTPRSASRLLVDLGRQYAWPWWNVLLAQPALRQLPAGTPAVAASAAVWALVRGHGESIGPVPWITTDDAAAGRIALPHQRRRPRRPPARAAIGVRTVWIEPIAVPAAAVTDASALAVRAHDTARTWGLLMPHRRQPFDHLVSVGRHLLQLGVPGHSLPSLFTGPGQTRPLDPGWIATAAAVALVSAHQARAALEPAGIADEAAATLTATARRCDPGAAALRNLHWISALTSELLQVIGRPHGWNGGLLTVACSGTTPGDSSPLTEREIS